MTNNTEFSGIEEMHHVDVLTFQRRASSAEIARYYDNGMVDDPTVMPDYDPAVEPLEPRRQARQSARRIGHSAIYRSF